MEKYKALADSIKSHLKVDGNSITEEKERSAYLSNLPDGITAKTIEEISKYNSKFLAAAHLAVANIASDIFKKTNYNQVNATIGYFGPRDTINMLVSKSKTYYNHLPGDNPKEVTKYMVFNTKVESTSIKGYGIKSLLKDISENFKQKFSK